MVKKDLARLLEANGLGGTRLFEVPELVLPEENARLPRSAVQPVVDWLTAIAADAQSRADVVRQTLSGALESLAVRVPALADAVDRQHAGAKELRSMADASYAVGLASFDEGMLDGSLLRGEVLARWQDFIGTGDLMRSLESRVGRLRDRIVALFTGRPAPESELRVALESGVEALIRSSADSAAERLLDSWSSHPSGRALLGEAGVATVGRLGRASAELRVKAEAAVGPGRDTCSNWSGEEGAEKRTTARVTSFGVNGAGLLLMLAVFASTGGLTGIEVGIAGGTSVLSQKLLEAVFGDQAVRTLTVKARDDLRARVAALLGEEATRFTALLDAVEPPDGRGRRPPRGRACRTGSSARAPGRRTPERAPDRAVGADEGALPEARPVRSALPEGGRLTACSRPDPQAVRSAADPVPFAQDRPEGGRGVKLLRRKECGLAGRPAGGRWRRPPTWPTGGWTPTRSPERARWSPAPGCGGACRSTTPRSRWPGPRAAASPRCSTCCPAPRLAAVGVTRPTTSTAQAALWEGTGAGPLLDWLEIPRRHEVSVPPARAADTERRAGRRAAGPVRERRSRADGPGEAGTPCLVRRPERRTGHPGRGAVVRDDGAARLVRDGEWLARSIRRTVTRPG